MGLLNVFFAGWLTALLTGLNPLRLRSMEVMSVSGIGGNEA
jgi:hypothetical protein